MKKLCYLLSLLIIASMVLTACGGGVFGKGSLTIVADESLRTLIEDHQLLAKFESDENINIEVYYLPTVEAQNAVAAGMVEGETIDVYLAENNAFIPGNMDKADFATTLISVFLDSDVANKIGWVPGSSHGIGEFKAHLSPSEINLITLNPGNDNNGLGFYSALLSSYKKNPGTTLTMNDVLDEKIKAQGSDFYSKNGRTVSTTPEAISLYVQDKVGGANIYNAITISEAQAVDLLNALPVGETGYFFYLYDATMITTAGIGCVKEENLVNCQLLKKYLVDNDRGQAVIANSNWRPAIFGVNSTSVTLKPEHGFNQTPIFNYVPMPDVNVINKGIEAYVLYYRPTVVASICADKSGSMEGNGGIYQLNDALAKLFAYDQKEDLHNDKWLKENKIYYSESDTFIVRFFDDVIYSPYVHVGNQPAELSEFGKLISNNQGNGGTSWHDCMAIALDDLINNYTANSRRVLILMGDGDDRNSQWTKDDFINFWKEKGENIPVITIAFGNAANEISYDNFGKEVNGQYYDGSANLADAFRKAFGNQ